MHNLILLMALAQIPSPNPIVEKIHKSSVCVMGNGKTGSGSLFRYDNKVYVVSCNHVLDNINNGVNSITVYQDEQDNDKLIKRHSSKAKIVARSPFTENDLAILELEDSSFGMGYIRFYNEKKAPPLGTEVWHIGSIFGTANNSSLIQGIYSSYNRKYDKGLYDSLDANIYSGCSGGGVFLKQDGRFVGVVSRANGPGYTVMIPARVILKFLQSNDLKVE